MLQSKLFTKTIKKSPKEEVSKNAQYLVQGGFIQKLMAGVYTFLPLGFKVLKKIEQIIREEMNAVDGQEIYMPALHPIENYIKTNRDKIDVLFHLKSALGKSLVLGQSHEEVVVPLVKPYLHSYKDLPFAVYQIQVKFRNELRAKSGILRSREFIMKDLYSFHTDEKDFEKYYARVIKAYQEIFGRVGIGKVTYLTYAAGGTFSQFSHEFQTVTPVGEAIIHICDHCKVAVNEELIEEQKHTCPKCHQKNLRKEKAIEVGNIFPLGTRFSDAFDLKYTNQTGKKKPVIMGCYGIGLGRVLGAVVEINSDHQGIIWPKTITPFDVHLLGLENDPKVKAKAQKIYTTLQKRGIDVIYDDRLEGAGVKLKDADLIGIPIRLIISKKTGEKIELKFRNEKRIQLFPLDKVLKIILNYYK